MTGPTVKVRLYDGDKQEDREVPAVMSIDTVYVLAPAYDDRYVFRHTIGGIGPEWHGWRIRL